MKVSLLEFKVNDHSFGIKTEHVKNVFDIELVKPVPSMPDYIAGLTKNANTVSLLVCFGKLVGLTDRCEDPLGKFAILVDINGKYYALVVDEIVKIQEVETEEDNNEPVKFYNLKGEVIEEITPAFLKQKIKVPPLENENKKKSEKNSNNSNQKEENFLIFLLNDKKLSIKTDLIDRVEHVEALKNGVDIKNKDWIESVVLIKDEVIKIGNLKKLLNWEEDKSKGETLIIVGSDRENIGFLVDDILDTVSIKESDIEKNLDANDIFENYFVYNKSVVPILSEKFIKEIISKNAVQHGKKEKKETDTQTLSKKDFLIFNILGERFAVSMEEVEEVMDFEGLNISPYITENPFVKGILALKNKSVFLISLEKIFNKNFDKNSELSVLVLNQNGIEVALLISKIEKIETVPDRNIFKLEASKELIRGSIITKDGELISLLNIAFIKP